MSASTPTLDKSERTLTQSSPDGLILLHLDNGEYYALDEVGARIWALCDGTRSLSDIVQVICAEYDAPLATVEEDVAELLRELLELNLAVEVDPSAGSA